MRLIQVYGKNSFLRNENSIKCIHWILKFHIYGLGLPVRIGFPNLCVFDVKRFIENDMQWITLTNYFNRVFYFSYFREIYFCLAPHLTCCKPCEKKKLCFWIVFLTYSFDSNKLQYSHLPFDGVSSIHEVEFNWISAFN